MFAIKFSHEIKDGNHKLNFSLKALDNCCNEDLSAYVLCGRVGRMPEVVCLHEVLPVLTQRTHITT